MSARLLHWRVMRGNRVHDAYRPNPVRRVLYWAARHPILFALGMLLACFSMGFWVWPLLKWLASTAFPVVGWEVPKAAWLPNADGKNTVDVGAFIATPWSVQATLVALVYPLVFSFVAVFLQRRVKADVLLRIYILDSTILPAGASSLALLGILTVGYFATPALLEKWLTIYEPLLVGVGAWFVLNIALTGYFLVRTLKYLQSEEQQASVWKAAIGVIYYDEVRRGLRQNLVFRSLSYSPDPKRANTSSRRLYPSVGPLGTRSDSVSTVKKDVADGSVLAEIYLPLLHIVMWSWLRRARKHEDRAKAALTISSFLGKTEGVQQLAAVEAGPPLRLWERSLVRLAFWHQGRPSQVLDITTSGLLSELAASCMAMADQGQFEEAAVAARDLYNLVTDLVNSGSVSGSPGEDNTALLPEQKYFFFARPLHSGWMLAFVDVGKKAVALADKSLDLFDAVVYAPVRLVRDMEPFNPRLAESSLEICRSLDHTLSDWWLNRADVVGSNGLMQLPVLQQRLYDDMLAKIVGSWSDIRPSSLQASAPREEHRAWEQEAVQAKHLVLHLHLVAGMACRAIDRGDGSAASRYVDLFLKWVHLQQGYRDSGYIEYVPNFMTVGLSLFDLSWEDAKLRLSQPIEANLPGVSEQAAVLAVRRHFEAMRLQLVLSLLEAVNGEPGSQKPQMKLAVSMALALINGREIHRGSDVTVSSFATVDEVFERMVHATYIDQRSGAALQEFSSRLHRDKNSPDVSGWSFGGFLPRFGIDAVAMGWSRLLCLLVNSRRSASDINVRQTTQLLARAWRKPALLAEASTFFTKVAEELATLTNTDKNGERCLINALREQHGKAGISDDDLQSLERACRSLAETAQWHSYWSVRCASISDAARQAFLRGLSEGAFGHVEDTSSWAAPVEWTTAQIEPAKFAVAIHRQDLNRGEEQAEAEGREQGKRLRRLVERHAIGMAIEASGGVRIEEPEWSADFADVTDAAIFVNRVGEAVDAMRTRGSEPAVVLWSGRGSGALRPHVWASAELKSRVEMTQRLGELQHGNLTLVTVNDAPVYQRFTPDGRSYVLPKDATEVLMVSTKPISADWRRHLDDPLYEVATVTLAARYGRQFTSESGHRGGNPKK